MKKHSNYSPFFLGIVLGLLCLYIILKEEFLEVMLFIAVLAWVCSVVVELFLKIPESTLSVQEFLAKKTKLRSIKSLDIDRVERSGDGFRHEVDVYFQDGSTQEFLVWNKTRLSLDFAS